MTPDAAAVRIQTEWRKQRLARHRPALKQLATAASQLRQLSEHLQHTLQQQPGVPLTQKQFLELSEGCMKILFALDAVTCGAATELRTKRKELTTRANKLLDDIQAAHKAAASPATAAAAAAAAAAGAPASAPAIGPQLPSSRQQPQPQKKKVGLPWFRRS